MKRVILMLLVAVLLLIGSVAMAAETVDDYFDKGNMLTVTNMYTIGEPLWDGRQLIQGAVEFMNEKQTQLLVKGMTMLVSTHEEASAACSLGAAGRMTAILYDGKPSEGWSIRQHNAKYEDIFVQPGAQFTVKFSTIIDKEDLNDVVVLYQEYSIVQ